jgi:hypothetical protein
VPDSASDPPQPTYLILVGIASHCSGCHSPALFSSRPTGLIESWQKRVAHCCVLICDGDLLNVDELSVAWTAVGQAGGHGRPPGEGPVVQAPLK